MKMWLAGCQAFGQTNARFIRAKISQRTIESIFAACNEVGKIDHDPEIYKSDVIVVYVTIGSDEYSLILSDFDSQPTAKELTENILSKVVTEKNGMSGLVELDREL